jgi:predicted O-methyltransferase YrrM
MNQLIDRTGTFTSPGRPGYDIHDTLASICAWLRPESYLEIGVDGGGSLGAVLGATDALRRIVLCDIWDARYCEHGLTNHDHITDLLARSGYAGNAAFLDGDSHLLLPALPAEVRFDLITVDGDHSAAGARRDLDDCWPHLNLGGVLVIDDVNHPTWPWLGEMVRTFAEQHAGDAIQLREAEGRLTNATAFQKMKETL